MAAFTLAVLPFADVVVGRHPGFLPAFFALLVGWELATAGVLLAQYRSSPRPLLLGVAVTYASSALLVVPHALVFPGVLASRGVFPQLAPLAPWLWAAWHVVFPLGLLVSTLLPIEESRRPRSPAALLALVLGPVSAITGALVLLAPVLPPIIAGNNYATLSMNYAGLVAVTVGVLAVAVSARAHNRTGRLGDLLLLAATASLADTLLTVIAHERWTVGWYAGRMCALAASAVVLVAVLRQAVRLADALAGTNRDLRVAREEAERQAADNAEAARRLSVLLEGMGDAFAALDHDGRVAFLNSHGAALLGDSAGAIVGRRLSDVLPDELGARFASQLQPLRDGARAVAFELPHPRASRWLSVRAWKAGDLVSMTVRDVSERRAAEQELAYRALHDSLTGLPNRTLLLDRLKHLTARRADDPARSAAILFVDLDRFKPINDTLGHPAGDVVLKEVAARLSALVRPADTVARLGGDEFVLLCEEISDRDAALGVADRVCTAVERPITVAGREVSVSASVGIALVGPEDEDPTALLADADAAMYDAKARRRRDLAARFDPAARTQLPAGAGVSAR